MEVLGVYREARFSPGRVDDDALILEETAAALASRGVRVWLRRAENLENETTPPHGVFSMAQGERSLALLRQWQEHGSMVINSVEAVLNCRRARTVELCRAGGAPMPESWLVSTDDAEPNCAAVDWTAGVWVKRADVHATRPDDVGHVRSRAALRDALSAFARRGVPQALLQAHCAGRIVKFYGVGPGRFFDCSEVDAAARERIAALAATAARAVGVEVFGGDCVLSQEGKPLLIDLNDWPSFARCRIAAARAIADYLLDRIQKEP